MAQKQGLSLVDRIRGSNPVTNFLPNAERYGLIIAQGKQLEMRLNFQLAFARIQHRPLTGDTPIKKLASLMRKIEAMDIVVKIAAMAWARAGDDKHAKRRVHGYEGIFSTAITDCTLLMEKMKMTDNLGDQNDILLHIDTNLKWMYFKRAAWFVDTTFFNNDISHTKDIPLVFQTNMMLPFEQGGGETITGSGGRTSESNYVEHPDESPVPRRGRNQI